MSTPVKEVHTYTATPNPSPTRQIQAILTEVERQLTISRTLKWVAIGVSAALGLAVLAVALLFKSSVPRKIATMVTLGLIIGLAWAAYVVHLKVLSRKSIVNRVKKELHKVGLGDKDVEDIIEVTLKNNPISI